jgi:hypothetical protein
LRRYPADRLEQRTALSQYFGLSEERTSFSEEKEAKRLC